jgi:hypothetical protein
MLSLDHIERPLIMTVRPAAMCMFCWTPVRTSVGGGSETAKQLSLKGLLQYLSFYGLPRAASGTSAFTSVADIR